MTTKAEQDLIEAFQKLTSDIGRLHPDRAKEVRARATSHLLSLSHFAARQAPKCAIHPTELAHNCAPCRGEELGRAHDDPATKGLPETPEAAREIDARVLGETDHTEREQI